MELENSSLLRVNRSLLCVTRTCLFVCAGKRIRIGHHVSFVCVCRYFYWNWITGLFCAGIGLFCVVTRLFCLVTGLFCMQANVLELDNTSLLRGNRSLLCSNRSLLCVDTPLLCTCGCYQVSFFCICKSMLWGFL